jgi:hypothetical protein
VGEKQNEWEFVYDPIAEQLLANGGMPGGLPGSGLPGRQGMSGNNNIGPGFNNNNGPGSTTSNPGNGTQNSPTWSPNGNLPAPQQ